MQTKKSLTKIGIIGEGIMGLSIANILQERHLMVHIQITTSKTYNETTSSGAVGFVFLRPSDIDDKTYGWYEKSLSHYWNIFRSLNSFNAGVSVNSFYYLSDKPITDKPKSEACEKLYPGFRHVSTKELDAFGFPSKMKYAVALTSTLVEPRYYLSYLENNFVFNGGEIIIDELIGDRVSVADWAVKNQYDVVVNCSGLGSIKLFEDNELLPMRGQIMRVKAPWFKHSFMTTDDTYAFTCRDSVVLGGFRQKNDWDLSVRIDNGNDILKRISDYNICLSKSDVIEEWTGLRPWKPRLRLEIEHVESSSGKRVPIVHNYGHGSSGIGLSWGTSLEVADLVDSLFPKH